MHYPKSVALVGGGRWGKNLARNLNMLGVFHTLCDTSSTLLQSYQEAYPELQTTQSFQEVLDNPKIRQVIIATPAITHYKLAKQSLLAGKDVYVEKPLCLNPEEGRELIALASQHHLILMVGHLLQYHPCINHLHQLVASGKLGKLQYIVSNRLNLGCIRTEENALWSFAPHDISVILSLCGNQLPEQVRCMGGAYLSSGVADTSMTLLRFKENVRAHVYVSWLHPFKEQKLVVIGSEGMVVFDDMQPWPDKLLLYRNYVKWTPGNIPHANKCEGERIAVPQEEPLQLECIHFLTCCHERKTPKTDGEEGLRVLKVLQAAQESLTNDGEAVYPNHPDKLDPPSYFAHPTAIVDAKAEVASGVKIWHFSHIMAHAKIGPDCNIGQNVVVSPHVSLERNVKVQNNVSIYTGVICEEDVFLGPSMVFTNVINPRSAVNRKEEYRPTLIRRGASIGANATILCGIELGSHSFVGAGAVVLKSVKPFAMMVGNPARQIGWMSRHGEKLPLPISLPDGLEKTVACPSTGEKYLLKGDLLTLLGD